MPGLLHIYDSSVNSVVRSSFATRVADHSAGVNDSAEFVRVLDDLVKQGNTFDRAVISTHGNDGAIWFGDDVIHSSDWNKLAGRGYERIFEIPGKIYFNGCHVGAGEAGWSFLEEAGKLFFRGGGGMVLAHDSYGFAVGGPVGRAAMIILSRAFIPAPITSIATMGTDIAIWLGLKGKVVHPPLLDNVHAVFIGAGGAVVIRSS